jgi:hypothetical protein
VVRVRSAAGRRLVPVVVALSLAATCGAAASQAQAGETQAGMAQPAGASLTIAPDQNFVGGQGLYWTGSIGVSGVRTITMQRFLGRDGDAWEDVEYFSSTTDASGQFAYWYPAPAMRSIQYRVVSDSYVTPSVQLMAVQPDLVLWVTGKDRDNPEDIGSAVADQPFGISVDSTPDLFRRPDTEGLQPIRGRKLTLQRRVDGKGDEWVTVDRTKSDRKGMGYFTGVTESTPGDVVYRVREEDWTKRHDEIGWFPSFPTYVTISPRGAEPRPAMASPVGWAAGAVEDRTAGGSPGTAAARYHWAPSLFDFAWEKGESLTSPPWRGTNQKGWWLDYSDGGGRVSKDGGGLVFDSKRLNDEGPGDFGTTRATLQENPIAFGRWEIKLWPKVDESDAKDYQLRFELVPEKAQGDICRTITVADFTDHGTTVNFGVNAGKNKWTGSAEVGKIDFRTMAFALEIGPDHITWFVDGEPVGTVTDPNAIAEIPRTMRISMVGDAGREMNRTTLKSDWQRGFPLTRGEQVKNGPAMKKGTLGGC